MYIHVICDIQVRYRTPNKETGKLTHRVRFFREREGVLSTLISRERLSSSLFSFYKNLSLAFLSRSLFLVINGCPVLYIIARLYVTPLQLLSRKKRTLKYDNTHHYCTNSTLLVGILLLELTRKGRTII